MSTEVEAHVAEIIARVCELRGDAAGRRRLVVRWSALLQAEDPEVAALLLESPVRTQYGKAAA